MLFNILIPFQQSFQQSAELVLVCLSDFLSLAHIKSLAISIPVCYNILYNNIGEYGLPDFLFFIRRLHMNSFEEVFENVKQ